MTEENEHNEPELITGPMPEVFQSFENDGLFAKCLICECPILDNDIPYIIEKAYMEKEVIFEYAMCVSCVAKLMSELSAESLAAIHEFFEGKVDMTARRERLTKEHDIAVEPWISHCVLSGQPILEVDSYQICATCCGDSLLYTTAPYAISGQMTDQIQGKLSKKTRERLDDFTGKYLGVPADALDLFVVPV